MKIANPKESQTKTFANGFGC